MRTGYVEDAICKAKEKLLNAYVSIEVLSQDWFSNDETLFEHNSKKEWTYSEIKKALSRSDDSSIWIAEEQFSIRSIISAVFFLKAIAESNKDIYVYLCVSDQSKQQVEECLEKALEQETEDRFALLYWLHEDDSYVLELKIRKRQSETIIRLYEDGNGVVIYETIEGLQIFYFELSEDFKASIVSKAVDRIDYIITNPEYMGEDDRYFAFPIHLRYGLSWKYPNHNQMLRDLERFESTDYEWNVHDNPLVHLLITAPEVAYILKNIEAQ